MEKIKIIEKDFEHKCTGCGACMNACPVGAIEMVEGYHTFMYPKINEEKCIHCKKCVLTCPINNYQNTNIKDPKPIAIRAEDKVRQTSSSGGFFYIAASKIIKQGGIAYGVSLTENQKVEFVRLSKITEIEKCQGSKYVQATVNLIYQDVRKDLEDDRKVIFFGMPCQIAGLKNYLNKNYDNLILIDIVCHGVPSQKLFDLYLKDKSIDSIKNVNFRDKKNGWRADIITIDYQNGNQYSKSWNNGDEYEIGFQSNMILRDSCENCKFCEFPRIGDVSIGDFWGIERYAENDGKGTSMVFINNERGKKFFDELSKQFIFNKIIDTPLSTLRNRVKAYYPHNENKNLFFEHINKDTFSNSIKLAKAGLYDVGIVGIPTVENFGGSLTYVGLYNAVKELGFTCFMIERPLNSKHPPADIYYNYYEDPFKDTIIVKNLKTKSEYEQLNNKAKCFLVGSDQMFHHNLYNNFSQFVTLDWVHDNKRKVTYAASFGHDTFTGDENERAEMSYYMKKFDAFSVRESSGVDLAKSDFGVDAVNVLDPVFLCSSNIYKNLADASPKDFGENYISAYILNPNETKANYINSIEKKLKSKSKIFSEMYYNDKTIKTKWSKDIEFGNVNDRLKCLLNSKLIITDSFHGTCLAIIMKKPFITIMNYGRGAARFISLLTKLNLMDRVVDPENPTLNDTLFSPIDYEKVYSILNKEIEKDKAWLKENLTIKDKKSYSTEDIVLKKLRNENAVLRKNLNFLMRLLNVSYYNDGNIYTFIDKINANKQNLLILIASKDTPGMLIKDELNEKLHYLGLTPDFRNIHWNGYLAIIYKGIVIDEKCKYEESVASSVVLDDLKIEILSAPLHKGNTSNIKINNIEYSMNSRGLNFVIYDLDKHQVVDFVGFDTHQPRYPSIRR